MVLIIIIDGNTRAALYRSMTLSQREAMEESGITIEHDPDEGMAHCRDRPFTPGGFMEADMYREPMTLRLDVRDEVNRMLDMKPLRLEGNFWEQNRGHPVRPTRGQAKRR